MTRRVCNTFVLVGMIRVRHGLWVRIRYEGELTNPLSLNRYTYVHNNPLMYTDPTGDYCVSVNGKYTHAGTCNTEGAVYLGEDKDFSGRPVLWNGVMTGIMGDKRSIYLNNTEEIGKICGKQAYMTK